MPDYSTGGDPTRVVTILCGIIISVSSNPNNHGLMVMLIANLAANNEARSIVDFCGWIDSGRVRDGVAVKVRIASVHTGIETRR